MVATTHHNVMLHVHCPSCRVLLVTYAHFVCSPAILGSTSGSDPIQLHHIFPPMFSLLLCIIIPNPVLHTGIWLLSNIIYRFLYLQVCNMNQSSSINPLSPELNPICYLLALLAHHFLHVSRIRVKSLTLRWLMSYIYGAPILDVSRSHTTTQHSR